jgi:hypothetical protein
MVSSTHILSDQSRLSKVDAALLRFEAFLGIISGLAVFLLMMLAVISVGGRNFFTSLLRVMSIGSNSLCRLLPFSVYPMFSAKAVTSAWIS